MKRRTSSPSPSLRCEDQHSEHWQNNIIKSLHTRQSESTNRFSCNGFRMLEPLKMIPQKRLNKASAEPEQSTKAITNDFMAWRKILYHHRRAVGSENLLLSWTLRSPYDMRLSIVKHVTCN